MALSVSHELLDVVDINDRVIGVKTRGEIHAKGLMHRAVHILVFNSKGELFIQKRSMCKDENPGSGIALRPVMSIVVSPILIAPCVNSKKSSESYLLASQNTYFILIQMS